MHIKTYGQYKKTNLWQPNKQLSFNSSDSSSFRHLEIKKLLNVCSVNVFNEENPRPNSSICFNTRAIYKFKQKILRNVDTSFHLRLHSMNKQR